MTILPVTVSQAILDLPSMAAVPQSDLDRRAYYLGYEMGLDYQLNSIVSANVDFEQYPFFALGVVDRKDGKTARAVWEKPRQNQTISNDSLLPVYLGLGAGALGIALLLRARRKNAAKR